ncbi:hypothetical protein [Streptomyces halstedii]|uniref:hypothetical protein n=1 Tax=Streptomyces halstedii TaxID=1944 RepID=UPI00380BFEAC
MDDLVEFLVARVMDESHAYVVGTLGGEALLGSRLPMLDLIERLPVIRPTPRLPAGMTPMAIQGDRPWLDDGPYGVVARRARPDGAGRGAGGVEADVVVGAEWPDEAVAVREETLEALGRFGVDVGRVYALDRFRPDVDHAFRLALGGRRVPYEDVGSPSGFRVNLLEHRGDGLLGVGLPVGAEERRDVRGRHRTVIHESRPEEREGVLGGESAFRIRVEFFGQRAEPPPEGLVPRIGRSV